MSVAPLFTVIHRDDPKKWSSSLTSARNLPNGYCCESIDFLDESTNQMKPSDEAESLRSRMQRIRDRRVERVGELQREAQRLVDWQEYVRSAPVMSLLGSVAAGFLAVNVLKPAPPPSQSVQTTRSQSRPRAAAGTSLQWAISMMTPVVTNAAKKYLMRSLTTALQGLTNEGKSTPPTVSERPAYSERN